jgi:hypothetical protein
MLYKLVCPKCGSDNVGCDAFAKWNVSKQEFELASTYDNCTCLDCDYDADHGFRQELKPLKLSPADYAEMVEREWRDQVKP